MDLSKADIIRLYGSQLFIIPEKAEVTPKEEPEAVPVQTEEIQEEKSTPEPIPEEKPLDLSRLTSGEPVIWKMKPGARLALILHKSEFTDRSLTALLKECIVKAGIDPANVGFGVIENEEKRLNLQDMSVGLALICEKLDPDMPNSITFDQKHIWISTRLSAIAQDPAKKEALTLALSELASHLT